MNRTHLIVAGLITALALCASSAYSQPNIQWSRTYGTEENDVARCVALSPNSELTVAGWTGVKGGGFPIILRTAENGDSLWLQSYGDAQPYCPNSIIACANGGYAYGGFCARPDWVFTKFYYGKFNEAGEALWERAYGLPNQIGGGRTIMEDEDGNLYLAGTISIIVQGQFDRSDMCLTKVSADGDSLWTRYYGSRVIESCHNAIRTSDGGFALVGHFNTGSEQDPSEVAMVKTDSEGNQQWMNTWWSLGSSGAYDVVELPNGQFVIVSYMYAEGDYYTSLMWITPEGDHVNTANVRAPFSRYPERLFMLDNEDFLICGHTATDQWDSYDLWMARLSPEGELRWSMEFGGDDTEFLYDAALTPDGGVVMVGEVGPYSEGNMSNSSMMVLRTAPLSLYISEPLNPAAPSAFSIASIFPNPFNSVASAICQLPLNSSAITSLTDLQGRVIQRWTLRGSASCESRTIIDGANLPAGQYRFMLNREGQIAEAPVVIVK